MANQIQRRMAVDEVIDMMIVLEDAFSGFGKRESRALSPAYEKLIDAVESFNKYDSQLVEAGVRPSALKDLKRLDTGDLVGGSPGPYIKSKRGLTTRIFMDTEQNPVTGEKELVPVIDPMDGNALSLTAGHQPAIYSKSNIANEAVMLAALKLIADKARMNPGNTRNSHGALADFQMKKDGNMSNVEGMIRQSDKYGAKTVAIPSHTKIISNRPSNNMSMTVKNAVKSRMQRDGSSAIEATESLIADGTFRNDSLEIRAGKLLRSDPAVFGNDAYDGLIITGYPEATLQDLTYRKDTVVEFPDTVHLAPDLQRVREYSEEYVTDPKKVITGAENFGLYGDGEPRSKVQQVMSLNTRDSNGRLFEDVTVSNPLVAQLLRNLPYERKPSR